MVASLVLVGLAPAEIISVSVEVVTEAGESVFASANHPLLGNESLPHSVKLSPHEYPTWQAAFDLPAGVTIEPVFFKRRDDPSSLADPENGEMIGGGEPMMTSSADGADTQPVRLYTNAAIASAEAEITSSEPGFTPVRIPMVRNADGNGGVEFELEIPAEHVGYRRSVQFFLSDGTMTPKDGPVRLHGHPIWWNKDKGYLYEVSPDLPVPSAPRRESFTFKPANFAGRTVTVVLPRGYDQHLGKRYPVLYAQDGQNVISPGGAFGSWDLDLIAEDLIGRGEVAEFIIVAIDNSEERFAEYIPEYGSLLGTDGRGGEFLAMIRDELMPFINSRYRTLTGPDDTYHIGSSLGGFLGWHGANEFEETFGTVAALSPSFHISLERNLELAERGPETRARLYIDSGTAGNSGDGYENTIAVRDKLIESGHAIGPDFVHAVGLGDGHHEAAWRRRSPDVLRWMLGPQGEKSEN